MKSALPRVALFVGLALAAIVFLLPSMTSAPEWWPWKQPIRLGLDLKGGTHLLYGVDIDKAVENAAERTVQELERELRGAQIGASTIERDGNRIRIRLANKEKLNQASDLVRERFPSLVLPTAAGSDGELVLGVSDIEVQRIRENAREQALRIIRNRIDQFGVAEPTVQAQGRDEIVVQLPGIQDPVRAKELIGRTALLEFKLVGRPGEGGTTDSPAAGFQAVPAGKAEGGRQTKYLLERRTLMTGDALTNARVSPGSATEGMAVDFELDARGAKQFGDLSTAHTGRNLAIVLDGVVESAPLIREPITGGQGQITGRFTFEEASDLANVLRNGALPAPLKLLEERTVGPSLGQDSIRAGLTSIAIATGVVIVFMIVYYRFGGVIADAALLFNVLFLLGAFAAFGFTLSLPGIAGIGLTVGMAVDANVLILERMREELRLGKTPRAAIDAGYERAWSAILDSNVTAFIAGLILFQFGSGPVRGFAVTLCLGVLTSLFAGVFGTRTIYEAITAGRRLTTLSV